MANMTENAAIQWELPIKVETKAGVEKVLATKDTYVDKNIKVAVTVDPVQFGEVAGGAVSATVATSDATYTTSNETPFALEITADASVAAVEVPVEQAGFADTDDKITLPKADAEQDAKTLYIKEGALEVKTAGSVSAEAAGGIALGSASAVKPEGYSIKVASTGAVGVKTAGWVDAEHNEDIDVAAEQYYAIAKMGVANAATGGVDYTEVAGPALISGDYLYINAGYTEPIKISLADLVPDVANVVGVDGNSDMIYNTVTVYDKDGNLVTGTMGDATLSDIEATDVEATIGSITVGDKVNGAYAVTGSGDISGNSHVEIATRGLAETSLSKDGTIAGTAELDATIAAGELQAAADEADLTVTPVIAKEASSALSKAITTEVPTGKKYVAVSTAAIAAETSVTASVKSEGYVKDETATTDVVAGAAASGTYYVEIEEGSHTAELAGDNEVVKATVTESLDVEASENFDGNIAAGILSAAPSTGEYITISTNTTAVKGSLQGTVKCTSTEGYITADEKTVTVSGDVEVDEITEVSKFIRVYDGSIL